MELVQFTFEAKQRNSRMHVMSLLGGHSGTSDDIWLTDDHF
jgi:hypothetical protein